jgi:hypothetical protein
MIDPKDAPVWDVVARDPVRRRRLIRRAAKETVRLGLAGFPTEYRVEDTSVVASVEGEVAHD